MPAAEMLLNIMEFPLLPETQNYVKKVMNYYGKGNIEIASSDIRTSKTVETNKEPTKMATVATATPLQKNLSFMLTGNTDSSLSGMDMLEDIFSYDDYMKFIEVYIDDKNKEDEVITEAKGEDKSTDENETINSLNNTDSDINYNAAIMNLSGMKRRIGGIYETEAGSTFIP